MFDLEPEAAGVCVDYINIYDGSDISGTLLNPSPLCDKLTELPNTTYTSTGNAMTIHLYSDDSGEGKGFEFVFVPVTTGITQQFNLNLFFVHIYGPPITRSRKGPINNCRVTDEFERSLDL